MMKKRILLPKRKNTTNSASKSGMFSTLPLNLSSLQFSLAAIRSLSSEKLKLKRVVIFNRISFNLLFVNRR